jgi:hypothetical protein
LLWQILFLLLQFIFICALNKGMNDLIDSSSLRTLAEAGVVEQVRITGVPGGFTVVARYGISEKVLRAHRGNPRVFKSLDAAARYAKKLGFSHCVLDLSAPPGQEVGSSKTKRECV